MYSFYDTFVTSKNRIRFIHIFLSKKGLILKIFDDRLIKILSQYIILIRFPFLSISRVIFDCIKLCNALRFQSTCVIGRCCQSRDARGKIAHETFAHKDKSGS